MCNNRFLESDGYCTQCGLNHFSKAKRPVVKKKVAPKTAQYASVAIPLPAYKPRPLILPVPIAKSKAQPRVEADALKNLVQETILSLKEIYGINFGLEFKANRISKAHYNYFTGECRIIFGTNSMDRAWRGGFNEYTNVKHLLTRISTSGFYGATGLLILVAHEFSHILTYKRYMEKPRKYTHLKPHGKEFQTCYQEVLAKLFPPEAL